MTLLGALRFCVRLACVPLICLSANGQTVLLSGTQLRGQGKDGVLSGDPVSLSRGGTIQNVLCEGAVSGSRGRAAPYRFIRPAPPWARSFRRAPTGPSRT